MSPSDPQAGTSPGSARAGSLSRDELRRVGDSLTGTGFLLEHRVHHKLQQLGFNAFLGALYLDQHSTRSREMDVIVRQHHDLVETATTSWCSIVVECKAWVNPVVVIGRPRTEVWRARAFEEVKFAGGPLAGAPMDVLGQLGGLATYLGLRDLEASVERGDFIGNQMVLLEAAGANTSPRRRGRSPNKKQEADDSEEFTGSVDRSAPKGYKAKNDGVYDSVLLPLAKAMAHEQKQLLPAPDTLASPSLLSSIVISFPVVVTSGPLIEAVPSPDPGAEDQVEVRQVGWTRLLRHFDDSGLPRSVVFELVQERSLEAWITERVRRYMAQVHNRIVAVSPAFEAAAEGRDLDLRALHMLANRWTSITPARSPEAGV